MRAHVAAVVSGLLFVVTACSGQSGGGYGFGGFGCELRPDQPHISYGELEKGRGVKVVGKVEIQCRIRVTSHTTRVWLQFERAFDEWILMGKPVEDHRIPRTGKKGRITVQVVFVGCVEGSWRTVAEAKNVYKGTPYGTPEVTNRGFVDCSKRKQPTAGRL